MAEGGVDGAGCIPLPVPENRPSPVRKFAPPIVIRTDRRARTVSPRNIFLVDGEVTNSVNRMCKGVKFRRSSRIIAFKRVSRPDGRVVNA